jgi:hypothetical protein
MGSLIGTLLLSPLAWYLGSPFDHSLRSLATLVVTLPITYLLGIPPAFITGYVHRRLRQRNKDRGSDQIKVMMTGAFSSTYLLWFFLADAITDERFNWNWVPSAIVILLVGAFSTYVLLRTLR